MYNITRLHGTCSKGWSLTYYQTLKPECYQLEGEVDSYLSGKQGGIKYHFLSLRYDVTWDWTQVSGTIGEHSTH